MLKLAGRRGGGGGGGVSAGTRWSNQSLITPYTQDMRGSLSRVLLGSKTNPSSLAPTDHNDTLGLYMRLAGYQKVVKRHKRG